MPEYPTTRKTPVTEVIHGNTITDNYRWLEDSDAAEVVAWSQAQNEHTAEVLSLRDSVTTLKSELTELMNITVFSLPSMSHGWYYWSERHAGEDQSVIYRSHGLNASPEVLLNPNKLSDDGTISIAVSSNSPFNTYYAYVLTEKGQEMGTLYVRNLLTGEELLVDTIPHVRYPNILWPDDESGFFYTRQPEPGTVPPGEEQYHQRVAWHPMGQSWRDDEVIFGDGIDKEVMYDLRLSRDDTTLIIGATPEWSRKDIYLYDIKSATIKPLFVGLPGLFALTITPELSYLYTTYEAEFGCILSCPTSELTSDLTAWTKLVAEVPRQRLEDFRFTADYLLTEYLVDAHSVLQIRELDGTFIREVPLPGVSTISGLSARWDEHEFFYGFTSYTLPFTGFRYAPDTKKFVPYRTAEAGADLSNIEAVMEWATSSDGTKLPLFVVKTIGTKLNGTHPTIMEGYGGFNNNTTPGYGRLTVPWIMRGGIWVDAVLRGGGEYGEAWHQAGITPHKQNTFDDFIAAAERLIELGYTSPEHLGIIGASNGGLLVAAVAMQRPELYKAVVCRVPLIDMVRFPKFLIASRWTAEYGDPELADDLENILQWSPYHNVDAAKTYPAMLIMTGDHDTRVEPLHARKFAALMQNSHQPQPMLLRTEMDAGHGAGTPIYKTVAAAADWLGFMAWQLGLTITD